MVEANSSAAGWKLRSIGTGMIKLDSRY